MRKQPHTPQPFYPGDVVENLRDQYRARFVVTDIFFNVWLGWRVELRGWDNHYEVHVDNYCNSDCLYLTHRPLRNWLKYFINQFKRKKIVNLKSTI